MNNVMKKEIEKQILFILYEKDMAQNNNIHLKTLTNLYSELNKSNYKKIIIPDLIICVSVICITAILITFLIMLMQW